MISGGLVKMPVSGPVERLVIKSTPFEGLNNLSSFARTYLNYDALNSTSHSMPPLMFR